MNDRERDGGSARTSAEADPAEARGGPGWGVVLAWAAYLGVSWTWCIGMYLPVLLRRDFGDWSFLVFAVPNIVGAALLGWVCARPGASERLVSAHGPAMRLFSAVTLSFQVFFALWMLWGNLASREWTGAGVVAAGLAVSGAITFAAARHARRIRLWSALLWCVSAALALGWVFILAHRTAPVERIEGVLHGGSPAGLLLLMPVCAVGFLLCPYLDRTFHHARQQLHGRAGVHAFAVGFAVFFAAMIAFTLAYSGELLRSSRAPGTVLGPALGSIPVQLHIALQLGFTAMLHARWPRRDAPASPTVRVGIGVALAAALGAFTLGALMPGHAGLSSFEVMYRLYLSFYGLVFPAYVWICMIPAWRSGGVPCVRSLIVWLAACAAASPCFWMAFIARETVWAAPGIALVLLARLLVPRAPAVTPR
jgi:hypothetical protein